MSQSSELKQKILSYETFLNDVLKEDLKKIHLKLDYLQGEVFEYIQLKNYIETLKQQKLNEETLKTQVDIGCNIFIQGNITDPNQIMVAAGLGYYVELSLDEALPVVIRRINILEKEIQIYKNKSAVTKSHIKVVLLGLLEIQNLKTTSN